MISLGDFVMKIAALPIKLNPLNDRLSCPVPWDDVSVKSVKKQKKKMDWKLFVCSTIRLKGW